VEAATYLKDSRFDAAVALERLACLAAEIGPAGSPMMLVNEVDGGMSSPPAPR
jgi:hypothetical protein